MSAQGKSRKPLIVGIVAAVVVLVVLLCLLLTQCTGLLGAGAGGKSTEGTTTAATTGEAASYDLYWNLDRADYDGKSEAGLSSRQPAEDGYFHVRFHKDGEIVELKVADRQTINRMEPKDLMGLVFDDNGIVIDIVDIEDMPVQQVGWQFYLQSTGGKIIKLNSSAGLNGMEVMIETNDKLLGIWDMTGLSGDKGCDAQLGALDRVFCVANENGDVTHIYIYDRSEYMKTHDAECQHCGKVVTWYEWTKDTVAPTKLGHYQLMNDIQLTTQMSMVEDAKICLDLNGKTINGADNRRVYSLHNVGAELAIMDTSEEQTGRIAGHTESSDQGGIVWVRYGSAYLYSGTLDASDMTTKLNGTAVNVPKNCFFYMYGGTIIGGTAKYQKNPDTGKYTQGLAGAVGVSGKFVMNGGTIQDGKARGITYTKDGKKVCERGYGGNVVLYSGSVMEMNGGTIKNGSATFAGGNIYMDGTAELTINGGTITGGKVTGPGRNGGNVFVSSKSKVTINGGKISNGTTYNCGGNLYLNGTVIMNGGVITGGRARTYGTGKLKPTENSRNVFNVNGQFYMYGGTIYGGFHAIDSKADDKVRPVVLVSGYAKIKSSVEGSNDLYLNAGNDRVKVRVGKMLKGSSVGVYATYGVFSEKCAEHNTDNFFSNVEGAEVVYHNGRLAIGRAGCLCGSNSEQPEEHIGECDGTKLLWAPTTALPTTTGYYYLTKDISSGQKNVAADADVVLDLNGKTVTGSANYRIYSLHYQHLELDKTSCICKTDSTDKTKHSAECQTVVKITGTNTSKLTITDSSPEKTGKMIASGSGTSQGAVVWMRYGDLTIYGGTLDASGYTTLKDGNSERYGTTIRTQGNTKLVMYGGNVIGGTQGINATNATAGYGGAIYVSKNSSFELHGGNIIGGTAYSGGNVYADGAVTMTGGNIVGGTATPGNGGNLRIAGGGQFTMTGGVISGGHSGDNGGNLWINSHADLLGGSLGTEVEVNGVTYSGGTAAKGGGNLLVNAKDAKLKIENFTIANGEVLNAGAPGGNIRIFNNPIASLHIGENAVITGGKTNNTPSKNITMTVTGAVTISDNAKIDGGVQFTNTGATITITGEPQITGGEQNLIIPNGLYIDLPEKLGDNAKIGITGGGYITNETVEANKAFFECDDDTLGIEYVDNRLMIGKTHCLCSTDPNATTHALGCNGTQYFWQPWNETGSLPTATGNYYLAAAEVKFGGQFNIAKGATIRLDLNGKTVHDTDNRMYSTSSANGVGNATLVITDTTANKKGTIKLTDTSYDGQGGVLWLDTNSTLTMIAGTIDASGSTNTRDTASGSGAAIYISGKSQFDLYGGTIIGSANAKHAGAIGVSGGSTFNMHGGFVQGGVAEKDGGNINVAGTFNMYGGTVQNGKSQSVGGNIYVCNGGVMNLFGGFVKDGKAGIPAGYTAKGWGGNIEVAGGGTLNISGGTVSGGKSAGNGGNIRCAADDNGRGAITMTGGTVTGGESTADQGGNMFLQGAASLTGGTVELGKAVNGGNITFNTNQSVTLAGVEIKDGTATGAGGNLRVNTTASAIVNIGEGTVISGGTASTGNANNANVNLNCACTVNITGGEINGYFRGYNGATINISGNPEITGGTTNLTPNGATINVGTMTSGAEIGINAGAGKFASAASGVTLTESDRAAFVSDDDTLAVGLVGNALYLGKEYCVCGSTTTTHEPGCNGTKYFWQAWTSNNTLPIVAGNYYLAQDVTLSGQQKNGEADATIRIDLNGKTVQNAATSTTMRIYWINGVGTDVIITDTAGGGVIKNNSKYTQGMLFWVAAKESSVTLIKGTLDGSAMTYSLSSGNPEHSYGGSGITVSGSKATFNMYGGTLKGGTTPYGGGAIAVIAWDAVANIHGGTITGAAGCATEAIAVLGDINISGGTITGGIQLNNIRNPGIVDATLSGTPTIDRIHLTHYVKTPAEGEPYTTLAGADYDTPDLFISKDYVPGSKAISITSDAEGRVVLPASGATITDAIAAKFTSGNSTQKIFLLDGELHLLSADAHVHCVCGGSIKSGTVLADGSTHICKNVLWTKASEVTSLTTATTTIAATADQYIYLDSDVALANQFWTKDHTVAFCFNGKTLSNDGVSRALSTRNAGSGNGGHLILTTCDANYVDGDTTKNVLKVSNTATGVTSLNHDGGAIWVNDGGTVDFYRGTIDGSAYMTVNGKHGVAININTDCSFTQYPGTTIIGGWGAKDTSNAHGGAIALNGNKTSTVYKMLGGTIKNGYTAQWGGNVFIAAGTYKMYAGVIKDGGQKTSATAAPNAYNGNANISINTNGVLEMTGGTVYGSVTCGNVKAGNGTINISGTARIARSDTSLSGNNVWRGNHIVNIGDLTDNAGIGFTFTDKPAEGDVIANFVGTGTMDMSRVGFNKVFTGSEDANFRLVLNSSNQIVVTYAAAE